MLRGSAPLFREGVALGKCVRACSCVCVWVGAEEKARRWPVMISSWIFNGSPLLVLVFALGGHWIIQQPKTVITHRHAHRYIFLHTHTCVHTRTLECNHSLTHKHSFLTLRLFIFLISHSCTWWFHTLQNNICTVFPRTVDTVSLLNVQLTITRRLKT